MGDMERVLATLPGVKAARRAHAEMVLAKARALFAPHDNGGGHSINITHAPVDSIVYLEGPAAQALEFGHVASGWYANVAPGKWVKGINVMGRAAR